MKQVFLMLVFWGGMAPIANATYQILPPTFNGQKYTFTISALGSTTWRSGDLITWIFPDGQFFQRTNTYVGTGNSNISVDWEPYKSIPANSQVYAFVAKKGGTGIPPAFVEQATYIFTTAISATTSTPPPFGMPTTTAWQVNNTWNFCPGQYTYLMISYRPNPACSFGPGNTFSVHLPPGIAKVAEFCFNGEIPSGTNPIIYTTPTPNPVFNHIFLKLQVINTSEIGESFTIKVLNNLCLSGDSIFTYEIKRDPHDPNEKRVNIKRICDSKNVTKLKYRVQFHNDGNAPVKRVEVWDPLVSQLDPYSYQISQPSVMNGLAMASTSLIPSINPNKLLEFNGLGLPGLNQTDIIYVYSQTIYSYEFEVDTRPGFVGDIHNYAVVTFFDGNNKPLPKYATNIETVYYGCPKPTFCKCVKSLFRPKKDQPKP